MRRAKTMVRNVTAALKLPPQLQPGVPLVELIGRNTVVLSRHRGLTEYTAQCICVNSREGTISVTGKALTITQMNSESLTVCGRIIGVSYSEEKK